jgi:hypothetical protein
MPEPSSRSLHCLEVAAALAEPSVRLLAATASIGIAVASDGGDLVHMNSMARRIWSLDSVDAPVTCEADLWRHVAVMLADPNPFLSSLNAFRRGDDERYEVVVSLENARQVSIRAARFGTDCGQPGRLWTFAGGDLAATPAP